jgi:hypothetical protein
MPFLSIFGTAACAAALPFALIGAIAAPLTWGFARDAGARDSVAVGAAILTAVPLLSAVYMVQRDNFSLFQPLVVGSLWFAARAPRPGRAFIEAASWRAGDLARTDGLLVLVALGSSSPGTAGARGGRQAGRSRRPARGGRRVRRIFVRSWRRGGRQLAVFGSLAVDRVGQGPVHPFDRQRNSITTPATLDHLLGMGIGPHIATRIGGSWPPWHLHHVGRRHPLALWSSAVGPAPVAWTVLHLCRVLFAFSALISAVHVPGGVHPFGGRARPFTYIRPGGRRLAVGWIAARRPAWDAPAARIFTGGHRLRDPSAVAGSWVVRWSWEIG